MRTGLARALIAFFWFSIIITIIIIIVLVDRKEENPEEKVYAPLFFSSTACFFVCFFHSFILLCAAIGPFPLFTYSTAQKQKKPSRNVPRMRPTGVTRPPGGSGGGGGGGDSDCLSDSPWLAFVTLALYNLYIHISVPACWSREIPISKVIN